MKKITKTKTFWLAAAAVVLAGGLQLPEALAYFTTHVEAKGGYEESVEGGSSTIEDICRKSGRDPLFRKQQMEPEIGRLLVLQ